MKHSCCFIDTSALFKRYIGEAGTEKLDAVFMNSDLIFISNLSIIEFVSNLKRLLEVDKVISTDVYDIIKAEFFNDIASGRIRVEPVSSTNIITALKFIDRKYVTPVDSIQLATVLNLKESYPNISFVCSDKKLCTLAENEGIAVVIPG